jgi:hypothetical protein
MEIKAARKMKCGKARYHKRFMKLSFYAKTCRCSEREGTMVANMHRNNCIVIYLRFLLISPYTETVKWASQTDHFQTLEASLFRKQSRVSQQLVVAET